MRNRKMIIALVTGALALATTNLMAQGTEEHLPGKSPALSGSQGQAPNATERASTSSMSSDLKASNIIGLTVRNETGVRLGKVQDLIVSMNSHTVPFAIVEYGGTLGIGATRVAVPITDLKWSSEPQELILTATKEEFESAATAPTGGWMAVAGDDWLRNVDRYYGQPSLTSQARYERQEATGMTEGREPVRNAAEQKGAADLQNQQPAANAGAANMATPSTSENVGDQVNGLIRQNLGAHAGDINMTVKNGVVTLRGTVPSEAQKQSLEHQIKGVPGVNKVDDQLTLAPE
jgi:osmotically-inducible protein OsmY/sporulation protein YlmC with PRC-barrel domain